MKETAKAESEVIKMVIRRTTVGRKKVDLVCVADMESDCKLFSVQVDGVCDGGTSPYKPLAEQYYNQKIQSLIK